MTQAQAELKIARPNGGWIGISCAPLDKASLWFYRISGLTGAVLGASVCLLLTACVTTPPPRPSVPLAAAPGSARFPDGAASRVRSKDLDFPIELRLPN